MNKGFSDLRYAGSKEPVIKEMDDLIKNKSFGDENSFVIEGLWAYEKIILSGVRIKAFAFCPDFIKNYNMLEMVQSLVDLSCDSCIISSSLCKKLCSRDNEEGFFLLCSIQPYKLNDIELRKDNLVVILDGLDKPGNIGTIIRSVDAAGGDGVILCSSKVRRTNQKLIKSSMGSGFILPIVETDIVQTIAWLKSNGFKIVVTDLKADKSYYSVDYRGRIAVVAGNEIRGISALWYEHECERVIIPMYGVADSLNVGVAASLVVYEASSRQREIIRGLI
ncbi:MAG: TrmH family RNA methyltransferase [Clostridia bacterium]